MEVVQSFISATSGIAGVVLGIWLASRNANKEKLIDLRRKTYGAILFDLWEVENLIDLADSYISEGGWERYFYSEAEKKLTGQISGHMSSIRKKSSEDYLIISDEFRNIYETFANESSSSDEQPSYEQDDTFDVAVRKYRPLLLSQARSETMR